jgi:CRP-like cAMP-binding protein
LARQISLPNSALHAVPNAVISSGTKQVFHSGTQVIAQGDYLRVNYVIVAGNLKLLRSEESGAELTLLMHGPGSLVGRETLGHCDYSPVTVVSTCRSELLLLREDKLADLCRNDGTVMVWVHALCARNIQTLLLRTTELVCLPSEERLRRFLALYVEGAKCVQEAGFTKLVLPLKDCELANYLGITPSHFSRLLLRLRNKNVVVRNRAEIKICNLFLTGKIP